MEGAPNPSRSAAWYAASIGRFCAATTNEIIGALTRGGPLAVDEPQRRAWEQQVDMLRGALAGVDGFLWLEFEVPRLGSRIDAVVVSCSAVVPIEFKVGATKHTRNDHEQAWDYALDLKNFHRGSHAAAILPRKAARG